MIKNYNNALTLSLPGGGANNKVFLLKDNNNYDKESLRN